VSVGAFVGLLRLIGEWPSTISDGPLVNSETKRVTTDLKPRTARKTSVSRTLVAKADLERIALQEIRSLPGTEWVTAIEVERQSGKRGADWTLHVIAQDGCDLDRVHHAANTTSDRLKRRYELREED
jgi:hypothetical protein